MASRRLFHRAVGVVLTVAGLLGAPVGARTIFPAVGGQGDYSWDDHCPNGSFLVGFKGRQDQQIIHEIAIICAPINAAGVRGPISYGPSRGTAKGAPFEFSCPRDAAIYGIQPFEYTSKFLSRLNVECRSVASGQLTNLFIGPLEAVPEPRNVCPPGEAGSGVNTRTGQDVNALALDCAVRKTS